jgi:glycosyl hydrolase family 15
MGWARAGLGLVAVATAGALLLSGGSGADPETPAGLPGLPAPFLGTAVVGDGGLTAAVDAYGDVVDLRASPAGRALIDNPSDRQAAGTVPADTGIVPRVAIDGGAPEPLWRADAVRQRYLPGTNVVITEAEFDEAKVEVATAADGRELAVRGRAWPTQGHSAAVSMGTKVMAPAVCRGTESRQGFALLCAGDGRPKEGSPDALLRTAAANGRMWLRHARPLGPGAPRWAREMYGRSLLVLRALTDRRTGALAAGARDGWAYVWPRDAATAAMAFAAAGYRDEAERVTRFLLGLGLDRAARFYGSGSPVPGRSAQGDAVGWVAAAARASGIVGSVRRAALMLSPVYPVPWRGRSDYREGEAGDFLANAIASGVAAPAIERRFGVEGGLAREGQPRGFDSAAAWAVRPFPQPALFGPARRTLLRLAAHTGKYGLLPGEDWDGGEDPWTAPTAWTAWSLAALGERRQALGLLANLRRAATPAGVLPERVGARTAVPRSTTPLAWSHAFAILALHELWPGAAAPRDPHGAPPAS